MHLFYDEKIKDEGVFVLNEKDSIHALKVLRMRRGDTIEITDGKGSVFEAQIIEPNLKKCLLKILSVKKMSNLRDYKLHIAIAPTKNMDRLEWFVEKSVEMGIDTITPIICDFSERKKLKTDRLEKIAIAAMKQSLKYYKTQIDELIPFKKFIETIKSENKFIAFCKAKQNFANFELRKENLFLVGPEGGFSEQEVLLAVENNYKAIKISDFRLRTETAGVMIASALNILNQK